jgi:hypothetical protein
MTAEGPVTIGAYNGGIPVTGSMGTDSMVYEYVGLADLLGHKLASILWGEMVASIPIDIEIYGFAQIAAVSFVGPSSDIGELEITAPQNDPRYLYLTSWYVNIEYMSQEHKLSSVDSPCQLYRES